MNLVGGGGELITENLLVHKSWVLQSQRHLAHHLLLRGHLYGNKFTLDYHVADTCCTLHSLNAINFINNINAIDL